MKKNLSILLTAALSMSVLAACAPATANTTTANTTAAATTAAAATTTPATTAAATTTAAPAAEGAIVKMGVGTIASIAKSKDIVAETGGTAQADVIVTAVGFDKDGKVVSVSIDNAQSKVAFNADGTLKTDVKVAPKTKVELGADYGMIKASAIKKEWFEQADALGKWMVGKTIDQIKGMKTKAGADAAHPAVPDEADLVGSVSITVQDYLKAVEEAWTNAIEVKGGADKVGLGIIVNIAKSAGKTAEKPASASFDTMIAATAMKGDKVAGAILDTQQAKVAYDADGKITTDLKAELLAKNELKDKYGMINASTIKKEWFEQAQALSNWTIGKTAAEIAGLKTVEKDGKVLVDDADLKGSVSVGVADYLKAYEEAIKNAK